jgi:hypothetical protein
VPRSRRAISNRSAKIRRRSGIIPSQVLAIRSHASLSAGCAALSAIAKQRRASARYLSASFMALDSPMSSVVENLEITTVAARNWKKICGLLRTCRPSQPKCLTRSAPGSKDYRSPAYCPSSRSVTSAQRDTTPSGRADRARRSANSGRTRRRASATERRTAAEP